MKKTKQLKGRFLRLTPEIISALPIEAIHEAGHAVGRFQTAAQMGFSESEAVHTIKMHKAPPSQESIRKGNLWGISGITYGPLLSRAIIAVDNSDAYSSLTETIGLARQQGVDVIPWATAKILVAVAGPAAEATATARPFNAMWEVQECANDFVMAMETGIAAGLSDDDTLDRIRLAGQNMTEHFSVPNNWNALLTLAAALPSKGILKGADAWAIYSSALGEIGS